MFKKLVAIEPVSLVEWGEKELYHYTETVVLHDDIPSDDEEIIRRIGDADGVLLSYTSKINQYVFEHCPNIRYVGMCCSLYSEESANVDIAYARAHGITVYGIRDYGDRGVVEFVLCELVRLLHGYDRPMWRDLPVEITGLKAGIIGLGVSGALVAEALQFMGAGISYYSRSRKPEYESKGMIYRDLPDLLQTCDVILTCLNKNVILLHEEEFQLMGDGKIFFNTSIGPSFDPQALINWTRRGANYVICDTAGALGEAAKTLIGHPNVICPNISAGRTKQAFELLTRKVLDNLEQYLNQ